MVEGGNSKQPTLGPVVWISGLSGAGKTTLAQALYGLLKPALPHLVHLDGDAVRLILGEGLGYREEDRMVQIRRIGRLAQMLAGQGLVVLVAALYANAELLAWNRRHLPGYFEIYLDVPLEVLRRRDTKGLYARAQSGEIRDVVGVDIPWQGPSSPDMRFNADDQTSPDQLARRVIERIPALSRILTGTAP